jgi:DNA-binding transcriptional regulator YiaG
MSSLFDFYIKLSEIEKINYLEELMPVHKTYRGIGVHMPVNEEILREITLKLTEEGLAELLDVLPQTIRNWRNYGTLPSKAVEKLEKKYPKLAKGLRDAA